MWIIHRNAVMVPAGGDIITENQISADRDMRISLKREICDIIIFIALKTFNRLEISVVLFLSIYD